MISLSGILLKMLGSEILRVMKNVDHFLGVRPANTEITLNIGESIIVNTLTASENELQTGHWFALACYDEKHFEVFDSLGTNLSVVTPYIKQNDVFLSYNCCQVMETNSTLCGQYACVFTALRSLNLDLEYTEIMDTMKMSENKNLNDTRIKHLFRSLFSS